MRRHASQEEIAEVCGKIEELGYQPDISRGMERTVVCLLGDDRRADVPGILKAMAGVDEVIPVLKPIKLVTREFREEDTVIKVGGVTIGGREIVVMAGPCAVERRDQVLFTAVAIKEAGAKVLRGGAFKTLTYPDDFPGLGEEGLQILSEAKQESGLLVVTEVRTPTDVELVDKYADILQVGARHMQNYDLLSCVAERGKPVLLRRGIMASVEELLLSAEFILKKNNPNVILCERGIRTFEPYTPFTLDLCAVPILKRLSHLPVVVDPSHGTGDSHYVPAMSKAAVAAGADGLLIEVHPNPRMALSHGVQALEPQQFVELMVELRKVAEAVGRTI